MQMLCLQERSWIHGLKGWVPLCVTEDGHQVVLRGWVPEDAEDDMRGKDVIQLRDVLSGELVSQWKSQCQHTVYYYIASWNSNNTPYLAHSCWQCDAVYVYDISRGKLISQYEYQGVKPGAICRGPGPDTLLLVELNGRRVLQLQWREYSLQPIKKIQHTHSGNNIDICYNGLNNNLYLGGGHTVSCIKLSGDYGNHPLWQLGGEGVDVGGYQLDEFLAVCCDPAGRVYISEWRKYRLLVVDGQTGELLHVQSDRM